MSLQIGKNSKNRYWSVRSGLLPSVRNFSFNYDSDWLQSPTPSRIRVALNRVRGEQHGEHDKNLQCFWIPRPDVGRRLMKNDARRFMRKESASGF